MASIQRFHVGKRLSDMVVHGDTIYLAGQIADDATLPAKGQTQEVLAMIDRLLGEAGSDKTKILTAQIFLADMADFGAMNEAWDAWVPAGHPPARATVEARMFDPAYKVEIVVVAAR